MINLFIKFGYNLYRQSLQESDVNNYIIRGFMLKRIKTIENVGNFLKCNAAGICFEPVTVIYGDNRNGKSTFCDILLSLSLNEPNLIADRKSVNPSQASNNIKQKVEISFSEQDEKEFSVNFLSDGWDSLLTESSTLYVFDQSFIHRNVMTGIKYTRGNSESISGFILGENAEKFEQLEESNQKLRDDRKRLGQCKIHLETHNISDVEGFVKSDLPKKTVKQIDEEIATSKERQNSLSTQISNIEQVSLRPELEGLIKHRDIKHYVASINGCLSSSMQSVHESSKSKAIVNAHKQHINNPNTFNGWASTGVINHLEVDCPFCGQELEDNAKDLIESYKTAFDNAFQHFIVQTKANVMQLQKITLIDFNIEYVREKHKQNLKSLGFYVEDNIRQRICNECTPNLLDAIKDIERSFTTLTETHSDYSKRFKDLLDKKRDTPYNEFTQIDFKKLLKNLSEFNDSIDQYNTIKDRINILLMQFKESQDSDVLSKERQGIVKDEDRLRNEKKRIELDSYCLEYSTLKGEIKKKQDDYDVDKARLEANQEQFLENYFNQINTLFSRIGSPDFKISRKVNRGGMKTVYDLNVAFKGQSISKDKFNCLFSESDRRALALCIFLSKIELLPVEEKKHAILVMDDPVTSFDNERISNILGILQVLQEQVKQIVITTHYKGMVSSVIKRFNTVKVIKIVRSCNGSSLEQASKEEMIATAHDKVYNEIMDFIERRTQDNKLNKLRPFLETELRNRYKLPLKKLGLSEKDTFSICITNLQENQYITEKTAASLNAYRTSLNIPSHELEELNLDNCRAQAEDMIDFIYSEL